MTRFLAILARFELRPYIDRKLHYRLVVREATPDESALDPARRYTTLEIYERGARQPAMTIPVGEPIIRSTDYDRVRATVCAGLAFASTPSCWDTLDERERSRDVGVSAEEAAWSHRIIGRWLDAGH